MSKQHPPESDIEERALIYHDFAWFRSQPYVAERKPPVDISAAEADYLGARVEAAGHLEALKAIGDELIALTGYGSTHVLSTAALARAFALTGLHRAAALAAEIDKRSHKIAWHNESDPLPYHGYREALNPEIELDSPGV